VTDSGDKNGKKPGGGGHGRTRSTAGSKRDDLPRRVGEIISSSLDRLAGGDEARAYSAWARAVGDPVTAGTRPKAFRRGQLTVECASSVWANELTYLGPQILRRMDEVAPGHPVKRFRFVVGRLPAAPRADEDATQTQVDSPGEEKTRPSEQGSDARATKENRQHERPAVDVQDAVRARAEGVDDGRLRAAIEAALRRSSQEPPGAPGRGTPSG
jgi:hypothetical protein